MHVPVEIQLWRLSAFFLLGCLADLVFGAYRGFRSTKKARRLTYHLLDSIVALVVFFALGAGILVIDCGEIRLYAVATLAAGFGIADILIGDLVYHGVRAVTGTLKNLVTRPKT